MSTLDNLCHVYNIDAVSKAEIVDLFKHICSEKRYGHREGASITAACCLFLVQRKNKQCIPINTICQQLQVPKGKFSHFLKSLKSWLSSNGKSHNLIGCNSSSASNEIVSTTEGELPDSVISLIRMICDRVEEDDKSQLQKKTTELVKLAHDCWLLTGRSPRSVVVACTFLCWKSMRPSRKKTSFNKFCYDFKFHEPMAGLRVTELKSLLLKLGQKIPSFSSNYVNEKNLLFHLGTILENSETLRNDLFPDAVARETVHRTEYAAFRTPAKTPRRKAPTSAVEYDSDMNASDIEISDSEIDSYLASDNKKKIIELCKNRSSESK